MSVSSSSPFYSSLPFVNCSSSLPFADRFEAGKVLSKLLEQMPTLVNPLLLALPRGGVPVACEIARSLSIALDIFLVRKFALPAKPDVIVGAVASGGVHQLIAQRPETFHTVEEQVALDHAVEAAIAREHIELHRRESSYRQSRSPQPIAGRSVIVVDDGLTTGTTMRMAIHALRRLEPRQIVAAVPVASPEVCKELEGMADAVVCAYQPVSFVSVRRWYRDFSPVLDGEIRRLLAAMAEVSPVQKAFHA